MMKYEVGNKTYVQKPLVLGQIRQLIPLLDGLKIPKGSTPKEIIRLLGDKAFLGLAIALVEKGQAPKRTEEDLLKIAGEFEWGMTGETMIQAVEDFFVCNPIASLLEKLSGTMLKTVKEVGGLMSLSSAFRKETSPAETKSSGDSHPESASPS